MNTLLLRRRAILGQSKEVTLHGIPPITIINKRNLISLKAFGGCVQNGTPTPNNHIDIVCNNGVLKWDSVNQTVYADGTQETINVHSKNLINPETITVGYRLTDEGTITSDSSGFYTAHIPVNAGSTYTYCQRTGGSIVLRICEYDGSNNLVKLNKYNSAGTQTRTITTQYNTSYVVISSDKKFVSEPPQFELGSTGTDYQPYFDGGTAVAEMLLKVGDYQDEQEVTRGKVTRRCAACLYDGSQQIGDIYLSTTGGKDIGAIIIYPIATPFTEQVEGQTLALTNDTNIIDITQASLQGLELEVTTK